MIRCAVATVPGAPRGGTQDLGEPPGERVDVTVVDVAVAGGAEEDGQPAALGEGAQEGFFAGAECQWEVNHDVARLGRGGRVGSDGFGCGERDVLGVVAVGDLRPVGIEEPEDRGRPCALRCESVAPLESERAQVVEDGRQRDRRRRVPGHCGERSSRVGCEHCVHRFDPRRRRKGTARRLGERRCTEELGDAGERGEVDVGEACASTDESPQREAGERGGDRDGDRRERIRRRGAARRSRRAPRVRADRGRQASARRRG